MPKRGNEDDAAAEAAHFADVLRSFVQYRSYTEWQIGRVAKNLRGLKPEDAALLQVEDRISKMYSCRDANAELLDLISEGCDAFDNGTGIRLHNLPPGHAKVGDQDKVKSTLKQFVRDWADEGAEERAANYGPLLARLQELYPDRAARTDVRVLVPGAGLARLLFEACHLGFDSQGNEFSVHMLLASYVILNLVETPYSKTIYPFFSQTCNVVKTEDPFRAIKVPDLVPNMTLAPDSKFSMSAGEFLEVYSKEEHVGQWNVFLSCFFLDTAHNIFEYLRVIKQILKPGGYLVNIGPLLFHYAEQPEEESVELSWEEVRHIMVKSGFAFEHEEFLECYYASNDRSMMRVKYTTVHFVAKRL